MKRVGLALTWDGARYPARSLPSKVRAFLGAGAALSAAKMAVLFQNDQVRELRICWVPRLQGGDDVLSVPFPMESRIGFKPVKTLPLGDMLGVVYRRLS
jgi:hypothetical protein